jgi:hypothetical protein
MPEPVAKDDSAEMPSEEELAVYRRLSERLPPAEVLRELAKRHAKPPAWLDPNADEERPW